MSLIFRSIGMRSRPQSHVIHFLLQCDGCGQIIKRSECVSINSTSTVIISFVKHHKYSLRELICYHTRHLWSAPSGSLHSPCCCLNRLYSSHIRFCMVDATRLFKESPWLTDLLAYFGDDGAVRRCIQNHSLSNAGSLTVRAHTKHWIQVEQVP